VIDSAMKQLKSKSAILGENMMSLRAQLQSHVCSWSGRAPMVVFSTKAGRDDRF
jgi:hypothetical protein